MQVLRERVEHAVQRAVATPLLEAAMTGLIRRIARRQILPRRPGAQNPEHAIENIARISPRTTSSIRTPPRLGNQRLDEVPLLFGQIHFPTTWGAGPRWEGSCLSGSASVPKTRH